jgi:hypothetical protein
VRRFHGPVSSMADSAVEVSGRLNPTDYCTVPGQPGQQLVGAAGPSARTNTDRPGRLPGLCPGSCANAARSTVMWSAAVFDPAFPLRSMSDSGSPVRSAPWLAKPSKVVDDHRLRRARRFDHAQIRQETYPLLDMAPEMYVGCPSRIRRRLWGRFGRGGGVRRLCLSRGVLPVRLFGDDLRRLGW